MLVKEVPNKWLWASTSLSESIKERDEEIIDLMPRIGGFFSDVVVKLPRLVRFKDRLIKMHAAIKAAGMTGYHGRQMWFRPDIGNEGLNRKFYDRRYLLQLVAQIKAEAKVIQDLVDPGGHVGTFIDHENFKADELYGPYAPMRTEIENWSLWSRKWVAYTCRWVERFMGQLDLAYPNYGRRDYGRSFASLSALHWSDPTTYRLKGGLTHPYDGCQFWTTWGRSEDTLLPQFPEDEQPLTATQILTMEIPNNTIHWGLYIPNKVRAEVLTELLDRWEAKIYGERNTEQSRNPN